MRILPVKTGRMFFYGGFASLGKFGVPAKFLCLNEIDAFERPKYG